MTDGKTKGGEDYEVTEEHPNQRFDEEHVGRERGESYEGTQEHPQRRHEEEPRRRGEHRTSRERRERADTSSKVSAGGSTIGAVAGVGGMVLAILGLIGLAPFEMLAVATLAVGAGMFLAGITMTASFSQMISEMGGDATEYSAVGGGLSTEVVGGATGFVLGLLALLGTSPMVLIPAAIIALGAAEFFGAGATSQMQTMSMQSRRGRGGHTAQGMAGASGSKAFIGIGVAALGILGLAGMSPMTLSLIGILALGTSMLISGAAVGGRMMQGVTA